MWFYHWYTVCNRICCILNNWKSLYTMHFKSRVKFYKTLRKLFCHSPWFSLYNFPYTQKQHWKIFQEDIFKSRCVYILFNPLKLEFSVIILFWWCNQNLKTTSATPLHFNNCNKTELATLEDCVTITKPTKK